MRFDSSPVKSTYLAIFLRRSAFGARDCRRLPRAVPAFRRSEDTVTSLWMSVIDEDGNIGEIPLADPRVLLADADAEDVPAEEKARRERAREGGSGIVSYCVDGAGNRVTFTINGQLFLTDLTAARREPSR